MPSGPAALSFFKNATALLIYSRLGLSQLMGRSVSAGWMSGMSGGVGLFSNSSKCSAHLLSCPALSTIDLPSLSFNGLSVWLFFPLQYSGNVIGLFHIAAACSASAARLSM